MGEREKNGSVMFPPPSSPVFPAAEDNSNVRSRTIQFRSSGRCKYDELRLSSRLKQKWFSISPTAPLSRPEVT